MDRVIRTCIIVSGLFVSVICFAEGMNKHDKLFNELDTNKNNMLNVEEAEDNTLLLRQFKTLDKNNDFMLNRSEFSSFVGVKGFEPPELEEPGIGAAPLE